MSSTHYIRSIHTSFTAAHSATNPWVTTARTSTSSTAMLPQHLYNTSPSPLQQPQQKYTTSPAQQAGPLAPATTVAGRRRAYAFRVAPTPHRPSPAPSSKSNTPYKFDPFADEPTSPVPTIAHLASLSTPPTPRLAAASLPPSHHSVMYQQRREPSYSAGQNFHSPPPVRRQAALTSGYNHQFHQQHQQHQQSQQRRFSGQRRQLEPSPSHNSSEIWKTNGGGHMPRGRTLTYEFEEYTDAYDAQRIAPPRIQRAAPVPSLPPTPIVQRRVPMTTSQAVSPPPARSAPAPRTPSPPSMPVSAPAPRSYVQDKDAKAKLVAGILLNRIHVPGRGRGRRVPSPVGGKKAYVPSGLSKEVVLEEEVAVAAAA